MPTRKLPSSAESRSNALETGKERKDMVPAPPVIPYTAATGTWLDTFYPAFKLKVEALDTVLHSQTAISAQVRTTRFLAELFISHFFLGLQNAILRKTFVAEDRSFYGIAVNDKKVPILQSEADINFWNNKATTGEAARIAAGGAPITFPSIANVNTAVNNFKAANLLQANAKDLYDIAQEDVETLNPEADRLILKMWNETETAFDTGDKPSMRRKSRDWGVVYVPSAGEVLSPDDFSITGTVTDTGTGNPLIDVTIEVVETGTTVLSVTGGKYFIPVLMPGTYSLQVHKAGYVDKTVDSLVVTSGVITTANIPLTPSGTLTTVYREADLGAGNTANMNVDGFSETPTTLVTGESTTPGASFLVYAAANVTDPPGATTITISMAIPFSGTPADFRAAIGLDASKPIILIKNVGAITAHWKFTFAGVTIP